LNDEPASGQDHEKVEKDREKQRQAPMTEPDQELRETPPRGAEPSEGEEVWVNGKDAQPPVERRRSWWQRWFGG